MNRTERIVIYGLLTTLLLVNGLLLFATTGTVAHAAPGAGTGTGTGTGYGDDVLGPADGVELLGEDDDSITLRNNEGRPSWGDDAHHQSYSSAYVHIGRLLNGLLTGDMFEEEREALREEIEEKDTEFREQLNAINERMQELDPESPEGQELRAQGSRFVQEYRTWQQQVTVRQDALAAEHLERAYREMLDAVNVVADSMGIDMVYRFIPTDNPFDSRGVEQATMAIRLRPVLRYPEGLDITLDVMEELALEID